MEFVLHQSIRCAKTTLDSRLTNLYSKDECEDRSIDFNTFFNIFSLTKWIGITSINNLFIRGDATSEGCIFVHYSVHKKSSVIDKIEVKKGAFFISIDINKYTCGYIYLRFLPVAHDAQINFRFVTDIPALPDEKLAIIITTFNRQKQVEQSIRCIQHELLDNTFYQNVIDLFVINNGDDLDSDVKKNIRYIKNHNLGGSGGFSRGLYEASKDGSYTHCLFMDDDAACEIESIRRTYAFLALAKNKNVALSGAMLYEDKPWVLHEAGAQVNFYNQRYKPLKHKLNLTDTKNLVKKNIRYIKNHNLGGSGGFSRGLYEASKDGSYTHCLFMDDDAACEIESIRRTYAFLALAKNKNVALSGAMLYEDKPWVLHEAGAQVNFYNQRYKPLKHKLNLTDTKNLAKYNEEERIHYGAWWFYAFSIQSTIYYPFPFFVRGDDILFGMMNKHHQITTLHGVASWQADFDRKRSLMTHYLSFRFHWITGSLHRSFLSPFVLITLFFKSCISLSMSYKYESARAVLVAFEDGLQGIDFWKDNIDCKKIRKKINKLTVNEIYSLPSGYITPERIETYSPYHVSWGAKMISLITLNGHLLPRQWLRKKPHAVSETIFSPVFFAYGRQSIICINESTGESMQLYHSKKAFFKVFIRLTWVAFKSIFSIHKTMRNYNREIPTLCTEEFWKKEFEKYGCIE